MKERIGYIALGGLLVLIGVGIGQLLSDGARKETDTSAVFDTLTARHVRIVDADGRVRLELRPTDVEDPEGPIDVLRVFNSANVPVISIGIYEEGMSGGLLTLRDRNGRSGVWLGAWTGRGSVWVASEDETRVEIRASRDGGEIALFGPDVRYEKTRPYRARPLVRLTTETGIGGEVRVSSMKAEDVAALRAGYFGGQVDVTDAEGKRRKSMRVTD